jgi:hypothetical protein
MADEPMLLMIPALALVMLAVGVNALIRLVRYTMRGVRTSGVCREVRSSTENGEFYYWSVISFRTAEGAEGVFESHKQTGTPPVFTGNPVPVRYLPANPAKAVIAGWRSADVWFGFGCTAAGLLLTVFSVMALTS